jgi:hypothetical protein
MEQKPKNKLRPRIQIFSSIEAENAADLQRNAMMTPQARLDEASLLQERVWGKEWTKKPMKKVVTFEHVEW